MSKLDNSLGLLDTLPFGRHKGQTVETVYKANAGYLVWLRQEKGKIAGREFFAPEVHVLLDNEIRTNKSLQKKYQPWDVAVLPEEIAEQKAAAVEAEEAASMAYADSWGAF